MIRIQWLRNFVQMPKSSCEWAHAFNSRLTRR